MLRVARHSPGPVRVIVGKVAATGSFVRLLDVNSGKRCARRLSSIEMYSGHCWARGREPVEEDTPIQYYGTEYMRMKLKTTLVLSSHRT